MTFTTPLTRRLFAVVLLLAGLLPIPGLILLSSINWPDIAQGMSAAEALPQLSQNPLAFRYGFLAMAVAGILSLPATLYILRVLGDDSVRQPMLIRVASGLAVAAGALRSLWYLVSLTTFPVLGRLWQSGDAATQAGINVFYVAINDVFSTVQEDLGVNIFFGSFLLLVTIAIWRERAFPRWTAAMTGVAGISFLVSSSEFLGIPNGQIIPFIGPSISSLWFAALGIIELLPRTDIPRAIVSRSQAHLE